MVAVVARVEAAGGIGTLEARGIYMSSVVAVGKGIPITLPILTTTPSRLARLSPNRTPRLVSTPTYLHTTQRWLFLALPVSLLPTSVASGPATGVVFLRWANDEITDNG